MTEQEIETKYQELCATPSDIFIHLPILRHYADRCAHITECGVRGCVSLFAFLSSSASRVVAIDILDVWTPDISKLTFICADDTAIEIENTDFLFIDTVHCANHLRKELNLHAGKVGKYLGFHDVGIFGEHGDDGGLGLMYAINEFLSAHPEWRSVYFTTDNNGLMILERFSL